MTWKRGERGEGMGIVNGMMRERESKRGDIGEEREGRRKERGNRKENQR